jgi:cell division protein FtsN
MTTSPSAAISAASAASPRGASERRVALPAMASRMNLAKAERDDGDCGARMTILQSATRSWSSAGETSTAVAASSEPSAREPSRTPAKPPSHPAIRGRCTCV